MSLELSKEMLQVKGHLADAKVLIENILGKPPLEAHLAYVVEIARMLQLERHHTHKKAPSVKSTSSSPKTDRVMSEARNHPQVPMMVSAASDDRPVRERKSRPRKATPKVRPPRKVESKRKPDPRKRPAKPRRR